MRIKSLGIYIGDGSLSMTAIASDGTCKVSRTALGRSIPEGLKEAFSQGVAGLGAKGMQTAISLGPEYCLVKAVEIPKGPLEKMARIASASGPTLMPTAREGSRFTLLYNAKDNGTQVEHPELPSLVASCLPGITEAVMEAAVSAGVYPVSVEPWLVSELNALSEATPSLLSEGGVCISPGAAPGRATYTAILRGIPLATSMGDSEKAGQSIRLMRLSADQILAASDLTLESQVIILGSDTYGLNQEGLRVESVQLPCDNPASYGAALKALKKGSFEGSFVSSDELPGSGRRNGRAGIFAAVAFCLIMMAGWIWLAGVERDLTAQLGAARKDLHSLGKDARDLEKLQTERNALAGLGKKLEEATLSRPPLLRAMAEIAKNAPQGLRIRDVGFDPRAGLAISGACGDDGSLSVFLRALEDSPIFSKITLLQSDWSDNQEGAVSFKAVCVLNRVKLL